MALLAAHAEAILCALWRHRRGPASRASAIGRFRLLPVRAARQGRDPQNPRFRRARHRHPGQSDRTGFPGSDRLRTRQALVLRRTSHRPAPRAASDGDGTLLVASLEDLLATKLKATLDRAEGKDYRDIAAILRA